MSGVCHVRGPEQFEKQPSALVLLPREQLGSCCLCGLHNMLSGILGITTAAAASVATLAWQAYGQAR